MVRDIGYEQDGFHWKTMNVQNYLHAQSAHIAQGVDAAEGKDEGAGDQGIMFGYATDETDALMPAPIHYSHAILKKLAEARKYGSETWLGPDAKAQLTMRYENGMPAAITSIVLSTQHLDPDLTSAQVVNAAQGLVERRQEPQLKLARPGATRYRSEVRVQGVGNLLNHMAGCCKPLPGDAITGFITQQS